MFPRFYGSMTGEFPAATVAAYQMCPRQAGFRGDAPTRLEESIFSTIVRHALNFANDSRIAKEAYDFDFVIYKQMMTYGVSGDTELLERLRAVVLPGLRTLFALQPVITEAPFGTTIAGVRINGTIDLVTRREDGVPMVLAFQTTEIPAATFALHLALAKGGVAETFPDAAYVLMSIDQRGVALHEPELPTFETIEKYVHDAVMLVSEKPDPGPYCTSCAYLKSCPEGRARSTAQRDLP